MNIPAISTPIPLNYALALSEYRIHEIGHDVLISRDKVDLGDQKALRTALENNQFKRMVNRAVIKHHMRYVPTASLPAATASVDLSQTKTPNWTTWLEPRPGQLYKGILGFASDRYTNWKMEISSTDQGRIKSSADGDTKFTTSDYPIITTINDNADTVHPKFVMHNYSKYTLRFAEAHFMYGHKYEFMNLDKNRELAPGETAVPKIFETIILGDVKP